MVKVKLKKNIYSGKLIVFEGTDGAGKTTLINLTYDYLKDKYPDKKIVLLKQPSDLARKSEIFQTMMFNENHDNINYRSVQLLTLSDRLQQNFDTIIPLLQNGVIIICDRYIFTSIANMRARNYKKESWFYNVAKEIIKPTVSFLVHVEPILAIKRIKNREYEKDRYLDETLLTNVSKEFLKLKRKANFKIIQANQKPLVTFIQVKKELDKYV